MNDAAQGNPESVDDALGADHERLNGLLLKLKEAVSTQASSAADELNRFARSLAHHMTWEDVHLFPAVKSLASAKERRSIESLEIDHERLRDTLRSLQSSIAVLDYDAAISLVRWLETLLQGHNYDEEHGVYVEADRLLSGPERRRLMERFVSELPTQPP